MHRLPLRLRTLGVLVTFPLIIIFVFNFVFQCPISQLSINDNNGTTDVASSVAVPYDRQDPSFDSLFPLDYHARDKRAVSQEFQCYVEKGKQYWEQGVLPAFEGRSRFPAPNFGAGDDPQKDSGWTSLEEWKKLPTWWNDAFKSMKGKFPKSDVRHIYLGQSQPFENNYGEQEPTSARYDGMYVPENGAVIMTLTISPRSRIEAKVTSNRIRPEDAPKMIPRMNQLSDLIWSEWSNITTTPGQLRYYGVESITNPTGKNLILEIFQARRGTTNVPWKKRITLDLNSDEGMALFGCPNGIAVNWLLIHHAAVLGRREPRVTIFNPKTADGKGDRLCMIWDLIPEGKKGSFGKVDKEPKTTALSSGSQTTEDL